MGWTIVKMIQSLRKWTDKTQKSLANLVSLIEETIRVIPIIKIFGAQQYAVNQFRKDKNCMSVLM